MTEDTKLGGSNDLITFPNKLGHHKKDCLLHMGQYIFIFDYDFVETKLPFVFYSFRQSRDQWVTCISNF